MTTKKPRSEPHTTNVAFSGLGEFPELDKVLDTYFSKKARSDASERISQAITTYNMALQTNPQRQPAQERRADWRELIECMKEIDKRLGPFHKPLSMLNAAGTAYTAVRWLERDPSLPPQDLLSIEELLAEKRQAFTGKPTLDEEIRELLLRLRHLRKLFEATPQPRWTNPGKPERGTLVQELEKVFDELAKDRYSASADDASSAKASRQKAVRARSQKALFVQAVFNVFPDLPPFPL